jgi:hypothetical protein
VVDGVCDDWEQTVALANNIELSPERNKHMNSWSIFHWADYGEENYSQIESGTSSCIFVKDCLNSLLSKQYHLMRDYNLNYQGQSIVGNIKGKYLLSFLIKDTSTKYRR